MNFAVKALVGTVIAFLGIAYTLVFRARKVQSQRIEIGQRAGEESHW